MKFGVNSSNLFSDLQRYCGNAQGRRVQIEEAFDLIKDAGFDCVDFGFGFLADTLPDEEYFAIIKRCKEYLDKIGLEVSQTHGKTGYLKAPSTEYIIQRAIREIKATAMLGCKYIVIHPLRTRESNYGLDKEKRMAQNIEFFKRLQPYLEQYGVVECIENLFGDDDERGVAVPNTCSSPEEILWYIDQLKSDRFEICLDTGHMLLTGDYTGDTIPNTIRKFGNHLKVLHVHDNDKIKDKHLLPFMGLTDWAEVAKALKDIDYQGVMSLEIVVHRIIGKLNKHAITEYLKLARRLADIEKIS